MDNSETPCVFSASLHPFPIDCRDLESTLWPIPYSSHFPKRNVFSSQLPNLGVSYVKWINNTNPPHQKKTNQTKKHPKNHYPKNTNYKSNFCPPECIKTGLCRPCFLLCSFFQVSFRQKKTQVDSDISKAIQGSPLGSSRSLIILYSPGQNTKFGGKPAPAIAIRKETFQIALQSPQIPVSLPRHEQSQVSFFNPCWSTGARLGMSLAKGSFNIMSKL